MDRWTAATSRRATTDGGSHPTISRYIPDPFFCSRAGSRRFKFQQLPGHPQRRRSLLVEPRCDAVSGLVLRMHPRIHITIVRCFRHQLLLPSPYLVLTKPLRLDIQCQRGASVKIGWKYLDD